MTLLLPGVLSIFVLVHLLHSSCFLMWQDSYPFASLLVQVIKVATGNLSFVFQRWHYGSSLWFLPCPPMVACFLSVVPVCVNVLWQPYSGAHIRGLHRVRGGMGLALEALEVSEDPVLPGAHGWTYCWVWSAGKLSFIHLFLDFLPTPSYGGPVTVLWVLLDRNGFL